MPSLPAGAGDSGAFERSGFPRLKASKFVADEYGLQIFTEPLILIYKRSSVIRKET